MRKSIMTAFMFLLIYSTVSFCEPDSFFDNSFSAFRSVAVADDIESIGINPAALGWDPGLSMLFYTSFNESGLKDNRGLMLKFANFGFGVENAKFLNAMYSKYSYALGIMFDDAFLFGFEYRWHYTSDAGYNSFGSWDLGFLYREFSFLSLGYAVRNLNKPSFNGNSLPVIHNIGAGIRPFSDRFTLSLDAELKEGSSDIDTVTSLLVEPFDGVRLKAGYREIGKFDFLVSLNIPNTAFGFSTSGKSTENTGYIKLSTARYRSNMAQENTFSEITLGGNIIEREQGMVLFGTGGRSMLDICDMLEKAKRDPYIKGLILKIYPMDAGLGKIQELREKIKELKKQRKIIYAYLEGADLRSYYLACACNRIYLSPMSDLMIAGLKAEFLFYKGTLDKLGIKAEVEHVGKYKGTGEDISREDLSPEHRENINIVLDDYLAQITSDISVDREIPLEDMKQKIEKGPYTAKEALKEKLVDELAYFEEIPREVQKSDRMNISIIQEQAFKYRHYHRSSWKVPPKIAVIHITGLISSGYSYNDMIFGNEVTGAESISLALRMARNTPSIAAVIIRIDSGGGSAVASDRIWHAIMYVREVKPVIISMSDTAASGGYFIASAGQKIVANGGTLSGSIGVVTSKLSFKGLFEKIGVTRELIKKGKNTDLFSSYDEYSPEEKEIVRKMMTDSYDQFIERVCFGRKLPKDKVLDAAEGKVATGKMAKEAKLIDEIGGFDLAVKLAKEEARIKEEDDVSLVTLPLIREISPIDYAVYSVLPSLKEQKQNADIDLKFLKPFLKLNIFGENEPLFLMPFDVKIK